MNKILIVEDRPKYAEAFQKALHIITGVEIIVCTSLKNTGSMPPKGDVIALIEEADVILLDGYLFDQPGRNTYNGEDLFPHCQDKKVIGISSDENIAFGPVNWRRKGDLLDNVPSAADQIKDIVSTML